MTDSMRPSRVWASWFGKGLLCLLATAVGCAEPRPGTPADDGAAEPIRLVLQITVDGLRSDLLDRYGDRFGDGGFRKLLDEGTVYRNAHYTHANTETIVGHATLATGAPPSKHGMIGNVWFDREDGELAYNIEDPEHPLLPTRDETSSGAQLDPAQRQARTKGRSPKALLTSTFSDELITHTAGRSKAFGVSGKDRSAVAMAGHGGKAFWYSTDSGDFVTSDYYYAAYPKWVQAWNGERRADEYAEQAWALSHDTGSYLFGSRDDRPYETDLRGYGRVFPHAFGTSDDPLFYTRLLVSPIGDELTSRFAQSLVTNEGLGQGPSPDYLSVSFSSVDAVNHFFGPSSLENEEVVLRLDRTLADLLAFIDEHIGLDRTLIVLSADHGMPEMPEFMTEQGTPAGRLYPDEVIRRANEAALEAFGVSEVTSFFFRPYLYLNGQVIEDAGLTQSEVEAVIADALSGSEGIAIAVARSQIETREDSPVIRQIRNNTHATRSGDVYVAQAPYWFLSDKGPIAAMHGSPWDYDTGVPIIVSGPGVDARIVDRLVAPRDVAPTLAAFIGTKPPSGSEGQLLEEVLGHRSPSDEPPPLPAQSRPPVTQENR